MDATLSLAGALLVVLACAGHATAQVATDSYLYAKTDCKAAKVTSFGFDPAFPQYTYTADCPLPNTTNQIQHFLASIFPISIEIAPQDAGFYLNAAGKRLADIIKTGPVKVNSPTPPGGNKDHVIGGYPEVNGASRWKNISSTFAATNEIFSNETYSPVYYVIITTFIDFPLTGKPTGSSSVEWYVDSPPPPLVVASPVAASPPPLAVSPPPGSMSPPPVEGSASQPVRVLGAMLALVLCVVAWL